MGLLSKREQQVVAAAVEAVQGGMQGTVSKAADDVMGGDDITDRVYLHGRLSIAGKLQPHMVKFYIDPEELQQIGTELMHAVDFIDVFLLLLFSFFTIPMGRLVYKSFERTPMLKDASVHSKGLTKQASAKKVTEEIDDYHDSITFVFARMLQQITRLAALVYLFDCLLIVLQVLGFNVTTPIHEDGIDLSHQFAKIIYSTWAFYSFKEFKRYLLGVAINRKPNKLGKAVVCDRVMDVLIYASWALGVMDTINFTVGPGLASLFAFGGLGTFVFGMASKDMAAQVVSGITITTSEKFHIGEYIKLGDGSDGVVQSMGWLYTDLRRGDETVVKIPNPQLANQRISNISRITKCQVNVKLRIAYADYKKIPKYCEVLKNRLFEECPDLITDGSRPFRVHWRGFETDHLKVVVDTHHNCKPVGDVFYDTQQHVFEVIMKVAEECQINFAMPLYQLNVNGRDSDIDSNFDMKPTNDTHSVS